MSWNQGLILSTSDAEALALMVARHDAPARFANLREIVDLLQIAEIVPDADLPRNRVSTGVVITCADNQLEREERITLAHPSCTLPEKGQVSLLSPVGAALLGRAVGDIVEISLPNGRSRSVQIVSIERPGSEAGEAAPRSSPARLN